MRWGWRWGGEARAAFEQAAKLTSEWALPQMQMANQLLAGGKVSEALPLLERAVRLSPGARGNRAALVPTLRKKK